MRLADSIVKAAVERQNSTRPRTWFDSLPSTMQTELRDVRTMWLAGQIEASKQSLFCAVVEVMTAKGLAPPRKTAFREWMKKED
jgi:hypothetical protein